MRHSITTIINYCTNDQAFLHHNIQAVQKFSTQIIVPVCDHFYNGTPENLSLIKKTIKEYPQVDFILFPYDPKKTITIWRGWAFILRLLGFGKAFGPQYWICTARYLGYKKVSKKTKYILFLDTDEIVNSKKFLSWLNTKEYLKYSALKLANYWYFRNPTHQALTWENSPLLIKNRSFKKNLFITHDERNGMFTSLPGKKKRMALGNDQLPMIHHYGWAKPKKNLLKKVATWGHTKDRNWKKLIENEFKNPFSGTDFIYQRKYKTVKSFIKP